MPPPEPVTTTRSGTPSGLSVVSLIPCNLLKGSFALTFVGDKEDPGRIQDFSKGMTFVKGV